MKNEFVRIAMQECGVGRKKAENLWLAGFRYAAGLPSAERPLGEPVAWRYRHSKPGMSWFFTEKTGADGCLIDGFDYEVQPLYTHADPGEPVIHPINMKTLMQAYEQVDHRALLHGTSNWCAAMATALRGVLCSGPSAPVERDERAELKPDAWRASINGDWEYFRSYEQALKELREWQSDYLPEELEEAKADGLCEPEPVYSRAARGAQAMKGRFKFGSKSPDWYSGPKPKSLIGRLNAALERKS